MKSVADFIGEHSLFEGMAGKDVEFLAGCGRLKRFDSGHYLARENEPADYFYLLLEGRVVIEAHQSHQRPVPLVTLGPQDLVCWSWLFPPYVCYFDSGDLQALLYRNYESPAWEAVAERCLSCANCTLACPTCFCSAVEDTTDLSGEHAERWQRWDSCFNGAFSYISGGSVRHSTRLRYRQWMTHKLATWVDQFGQSGCVGCGRCISWCPVGIDLTEQILSIREAEVV